MKKLLLAAAILLVAAGAYAQAPQKYGIKCGIVKTVTDASGRKSYTTVWFDDYGAKEKSVVKMDMGGGMGEAEWVTISLPDGKSYLLDSSRKTYSVMPRNDVNYLNMPEDVAKARKATVLGEETIDGRLCVKWEEHVKQVLSTVTMVSWVWNGIPIKYTIDNPKSETTLVSLEQPKSMEASVFGIPAGYKKR